MQGELDEHDQAFLTFDAGQGPLDFLVDTGFNGALIIGEELFNPLEADDAGAVTAELASNQSFRYQTFLIEFEWFGEPIRTRILVGPGKECLIGTSLLNPHRLEIDYGSRRVELIRGDSW